MLSGHIPQTSQPIIVIIQTVISIALIILVVILLSIHVILVVIQHVVLAICLVIFPTFPTSILIRFKVIQISTCGTDKKPQHRV